MLHLSFLLFLAAVSSVIADDCGLDSDVFNKFVEDVKKGDNKEDIFLSHIWPKIQEFFPTEAVVPAVEVEYKHFKEPDKGEQGAKEQVDGNPNSQGGDKSQDEKNGDGQGEEKHTGQGDATTTGQEDKAQPQKQQTAKDGAKEVPQELLGESYSCQTETKMTMKLDKHLQKTYTVEPKNKKAKLEVEAELKMDEPFFFELVGKTYDVEKAFVPTKMKYTFKGSNKVKISMLIPDLTAKKFSAECLVTVTDIKAFKFDNPDCAGTEITDEYLTQNEEVAKQIPLHYFQEMEENGKFYEAVNAGLTKAFIEKMKEAKKKDGVMKLGEKKTWICISDELKKSEPDLKRKFIYGEKYTTYCSGIKAS